MKPLSIEEAYSWAQRFAAREWRLILPIAFAFIAFPPLVLDLLAPQLQMALFASLGQGAKPMATAQAANLGWMLLITPLLLLFSNVGGLAINALALLPGISVREALAVALRRLWVLFASQLLLLMGMVGLLLLLGTVALAGRTAAGGLNALIGGVVLGLGFYAAVRVVLLTPMIVRRHVGPVAALRESWVATHGHVWRILAAVFIYLAGAMVVTVALSSALGALLVLAGKVGGVPELGVALDAVLVRALAALAGVGLHLLVVGLFRQLDTSSRGV